MAVTTGLVHRTLRVPMSVSTNQTLMGSFISQVSPTIFTDANGTYSWFNNYYALDSSSEFTIIEWVMTPANDANFITNILPGMLTSAGLTSIQTFTHTVDAGY